MSLLRALRAYVGLGPDEDYEEHYYGDRSDSRSARPVGARSSRRSTGSYLDDYGAHLADDDEPVIDIRNARIDARRADGSDPVSRPANQSRNRIGDRQSRRSRLSENEELLDQIVSGDHLADDARPSLGSHDEPESSRDRHERADSRSDDRAEHGEAETSQGAVVRSIDSARSRPRTLNPESFSDAKHVADEFKRGTPVVVNLQGLERDLARRLVDFASGICYALDGKMEKLAPQVFLLTPEGLSVSDTDRRRIEERGYAR